ncbi:hypothetical protein INR49_016228 [Caranx melampygus]|nr:hypothetical protein INR49_016228 [Caranx melampygus]
MKDEESLCPHRGSSSSSSTCLHYCGTAGAPYRIHPADHVTSPSPVWTVTSAGVQEVASCRPDAALQILADLSSSSASIRWRCGPAPLLSLTPSHDDGPHIIYSMTQLPASGDGGSVGKRPVGAADAELVGGRLAMGGADGGAPYSTGRLTIKLKWFPIDVRPLFCTGAINLLIIQ